MQPGPGFQVDLFAAEPMLFNPTSIDVDHKGRVWVAEAVNYRRVAFNRPIIRPEGDRIVVLVDETGEGKATKAVTFYQGKDLYGPLSVCVIPQADGKGFRVLVAQSPDILEFWDKDGDLKADGPPTKFLTGFGGFDHDHGVHGLNIGPDGKLYFTVGDSGVTALQSRDKKGPVFKSNTTTIQKGTVWRCDLDGNNVELIAHNFRNNYECCVDSFGEIWLSDNDDDGNQQTRICYVMPGGNYGYGPRGDGKSHWHEEDPGVVHKVLRTGFGSPTGITFYEGSLFPEKYRGALLHCDAGPREVRAFHRKPKGAGYELDKEVILTSTDNWFRPSDVCVAPDGSIFVADWYDQGVGGHNMKDPQDGRIYRLTPKGHKGYKVPEMKLDTKDGVLAALASPNLATRAEVSNAIAGMEAMDAIKFILDNIAKESSLVQARCHWQIVALSGKANRDARPQGAAESYWKFMQSMKGNPVFHAMFVRSHILQAIKQPELIPMVIESLDRGEFTNESIAVAREYLLGFRSADAGLVTKPFFGFAKLYDGKDIFYRAALNIACGTDPKRRDEILADFDKHFPDWNDKTADLVWELRPKNSIANLVDRLRNDRIMPYALQQRAFDIIAGSDDETLGLKLLSLWQDGPDIGPRRDAMRILLRNLPGKWAKLKENETLLKWVNAAFRPPLPNKVDVTFAENRGYAIQAAGLIGSPKHEFFIRRIAEDETDRDRAAAIEALGNFKTKDAAAALEKLVKNDFRASGLALASLAKMQTPESNAALQRFFTDEKAVDYIRLESMKGLASTKPGSDWLLKLKDDGKFPETLIPETGKLLRNSPFRDVQAKAKLAFPTPGKLDPKKLPAIDVLAKRTGDAARGKKVWDASLAGAAQCAKCHTVLGIGGQVGPDLSMIGKKGGKENILESILQPSKAIADQYVQVSVTTTADVTVSGLVVSDTPQALTLRDANGKDTVIPKGDIASQKKLAVSLMPEDIVAALDEDELLDLVAYLTTLQKPALTPAEFKLAGPFPAKDMLDALNKDHGPESKLEGVKWTKIRPDAKGYFDLAAAHGDKAANSASYLYAEFDSPTFQQVDVLLGPDDGAKLWLNGKEVFKSEATRAAAPGAEKVTLSFTKGVNRLLLKVANGNNPHGTYITLVSTEELKQVPVK
jgi:putative membrane-bound dehydrogenase-like protein